LTQPLPKFLSNIQTLPHRASQLASPLLRENDTVTSASLIAGTTVGAGVLALPAVTLPAGVVPSTLVLALVWLYMLVSGLLIAEANLQVMAATGRADVGLLGTIQALLGKGGVVIAGVLYMFIHYALLVAYIARGGDLLTGGLVNLEKLVGLSVQIPLWWGHIAFAVLFGSLLYWGSERFVGWINAVLLAVVIVAFAALLVLCAGNLAPERWLHRSWGAASSTVPVIVVAFVYHNVVPIVTTRLAGDVRKVRSAIVLGALVPLVMFVVWNAVILGSVDAVGGNAAIDLEVAVIDPIERLRLVRSQPALGQVISIFSEFAIATSFIGFVYGLLNVFRDLASFIDRNRTEDTEQSEFAETVPSEATTKSFQKPLRYLLVLIPPLALSVTSPNIFFSAIDLAGAFGNSILFGIIPAVMAWKLRTSSALTTMPAFLNSRPVLVAMITLAATIIVQNAFLILQRS